MEFSSSENIPDIEKEKQGLITAASALEEIKIIKLAKLLGYAIVEGPEEALKMVLDKIKNESRKEVLEDIQRKITNIDKIEAK